MLLNLSGKSFCLSQQHPVLHQISSILSEYHTTIDNFSFFSNGKLLESFENISPSATISAIVPLKGGKGGYGAKLKTEGGKKVRPNDNMFSRDANGQRIVHAAQEKQCIEYCKKKMQEEKHVTQQRQKCKILESTLKEGQMHLKLDRAYKKDIETTERTITDSILIGRKKLMEKSRLQAKTEARAEEEKEEVKEGVEQEEEGKVDYEQKDCVKRPLPVQFKVEVKGSAEKKQKIQEAYLIQPQPSKPSARNAFAMLFNK